MFNAYSDKTSVWLYLFLPHLFKQKQMTKIQTIPYVVVWFCAIRLFVLSLGYHTQFMPVSIALHIRKMTAEKLRFVRKKRKKKNDKNNNATNWLTDWLNVCERNSRPMWISFDLKCCFCAHNLLLTAFIAIATRMDGSRRKKISRS